MIRTTLEQDHKRFRRDCSGFVEAILSNLGHDIPGFIQQYGIRTNGVAQIHKYIERMGTIYKDQMPKVGDLIFFSNTYDVNRDGKINDPLSHIGVVTKIDKEGTISFKHVLHATVKTDYINFSKPTMHTYKGKIINSYIRRSGKNSAYPATTSQLFDFFGSLEP
ncbi:MAG: C40 family peptidase [Proteobacteria bacterium]|nr:C40 family peptidase [Pseudomonadota bacterium]